MKTVKLCDICDVRDGTHDSPSYYSDGYPFITTKNLVNGTIDFSTASLICEEDFRHFDKRSHVDDGDILMPMIGTIGGAIIVNKDREFAIKNVALIKKDKECIDFNFLRHVLNSNKMLTYFEQFKTGGTQKFISLNFIRNLPIPEKSLPEQQKIAAHLDSIQSAIDNKKKQLSELDELVKSKFVEIFGDPETNPHNFTKKKIDDFATCVAGATPSTKVPEYWENGTIPWMSSGEVHLGRIYDTESKISQAGYDSCSTKMIPAHTVVIALAGQGKTRGTVGVAEISLCTNQSLCAVIINEEANADYLYSYLQLQYENLRRISNGDGGRGGLNLKLIGNFEVILPDINLQNEWVSYVQKIDSAKSIIKTQLVDLQELLDSKMDEYFGDNEE